MDDLLCPRTYLYVSMEQVTRPATPTLRPVEPLPHLVYEDLKLDVLVDLEGPGDCLMQLDQSLMVVVLSVYHKDECPTPAKDVLGVKGWVKEINLAREIPYLKGERQV